ncbi:hypothetical protein [Streptosporangium sp. NPDC004631]
MTEEDLAAVLAAVVTPQRLHAELDARRRGLGLKWWQVAVALDIGEDRLRRVRTGQLSDALRDRATAWLEKTADQAFSRIREVGQTGQD